MNQYTLSLIMLFSLIISFLHAHESPIFATPEHFDEQLYRSLVYIPKEVRAHIFAITDLLPHYSWSTIYKDLCHAMQHNATVMQYQDMISVLNECLEACHMLPSDTGDIFTSELQQYKKMVDAGKAHVCNWKSDEDINEIVTRNFDGSREILQLYTRNLTVDGIETVNGLLTVNGILKVNGRIFLNGTDINTVIANAASAAVIGGAVTSVNGGNGINITGTPTAPTVNLTAPVSVANGGTGLTSVTAHDLVVGNGTSPLTLLAPSATAGIPLVSQGSSANPAYSTVVVAGGGTGATTLTGVLIGNGTSAVIGNPVTQFDVLVGGASNAITSISPSTSGFVLTSNGTSANPTFQAPAASSISITGDTGGPLTGNSFIFTGSATGLTFNGTAAPNTEALSGTLSIAHGGTNATSMTTTNGFVYYNGTSLVTTSTTGTSGQVLTSNGAGSPPTFQPAASGGITTLQGDDGSQATPIAGVVDLFGNNAGASVQFSVFAGPTNELDLLLTDVNSNTYLGISAGTASGDASNNNSHGSSALGGITQGSYNNVFGTNAMAFLTTGNSNSGFGHFALQSIQTGNYNIGIGDAAGALYTGANSNNIVLNHQGVAGESNTLRIGTATGTGNQQLNRAFISGIRGITTGVVDALPVLIDSANQLGNISSSKRFKENIVPMPTSFSENVLNLNPTLFNYTQDETKKQTWGLIAEDVQQIFPQLVISDKEGLPFTVKYHELPVLLLNELIKLKKEHVEMKQELENLKKGT